MSDLVQTVTVGFQDPVNSTDLVNRMLTGIVLPKVYRGGEVTSAGSNLWNIAPLVALVKSQDALWSSTKRSQARVEFFAQSGVAYAAQVTCVNGKYIVIRWQSAENYPATDYDGGLATIVGDVDTLLENDVVICQIVDGVPNYGETTAASGSGVVLQSKTVLDSTRFTIASPFRSLAQNGDVPLIGPSLSFHTEYTQLQATITPLSASSRIRMKARVWGEAAGYDVLYVAMTVNASTTAFAAGECQAGNPVVGGFRGMVEAYGEGVSTGTVNPLVVHVWVASTGSLFVNGTIYAAGQLLGGCAFSSLEVTEVTP